MKTYAHAAKANILPWTLTDEKWDKHSNYIDIINSYVLALAGFSFLKKVCKIKSNYIATPFPWRWLVLSVYDMLSIWYFVKWEMIAEDSSNIKISSIINIE